MTGRGRICNAKDIICKQDKRINFADWKRSYLLHLTIHLPLSALLPLSPPCLSLFLITTDGIEVAARAYFIGRE